MPATVAGSQNPSRALNAFTHTTTHRSPLLQVALLCSLHYAHSINLSSPDMCPRISVSIFVLKNPGNSNVFEFRSVVGLTLTPKREARIFSRKAQVVFRKVENGRKTIQKGHNRSNLKSTTFKMNAESTFVRPKRSKRTNEQSKRKKTAKDPYLPNHHASWGDEC